MNKNGCLLSPSGCTNMGGGRWVEESRREQVPFGSTGNEYRALTVRHPFPSGMFSLVRKLTQEVKALAYTPELSPQDPRGRRKELTLESCVNIYREEIGRKGGGRRERVQEQKS